MLAEGISREALRRVMDVLASGEKNTRDKLKECLKIIDMDCQDVRVYVWAADGRNLVPIYPERELADFDMLNDIAEGLLISETERLDGGESAMICGEKIINDAGEASAVVLVEKKRKGMLPAGRLNPFHNPEDIMDVIKKICLILKPEERLDEYRLRANVLEIPDKMCLLESIRDGIAYSVIGLISAADADALLDASGYVFTSQLMREWVKEVIKITLEDAELYYCSDTSFIIAYKGAADTGIGIMKLLADRLSEVKMIRYGDGRLVSVSAKASVVAVPMEEEYYHEPSKMLRSVLRLGKLGKPFMLFEKRHFGQNQKGNTNEEEKTVTAENELGVSNLFMELMGSTTGGN